MDTLQDQIQKSFRNSRTLPPKDRTKLTAAFPDVESFEIEVVESWKKLGRIQQRKRKLNSFESLGVVYPSFAHPKTRDSFSVNLTDLFLSAYQSRLTEKIIFKDYPDLLQDPQGNDQKIDRRIVCKIKYRAPNSN